MKKLFLIGLAATAMLASCSNDETVEMAQQKAIDFTSFVDKSTRATVDDDVTLKNLGSIEVYGWRDNDQIFKEQLVNVAEDGKGTYTPIQYWEGGHTYAFEAIAPKNGEKGIEFTAAKNGGTIVFTSDSETDLLYSKAEDVTTADKIAAKPAAVAFTFKHLLSRVKFTFVNGFPANAAAKISVADVKITNAYKKGTINPATENAVWSAEDNTLEVPFAGNVVDVAAGNAEGSTEHMYLIPHATPEYTVTFTVTLDQNGVTSEYAHEVILKTGMVQGNSYNFIATLSPQNIDPETEMYPIEFTATVTDWTDFEDVNIE